MIETILSLLSLSGHVDSEDPNVWGADRHYGKLEENHLEVVIHSATSPYQFHLTIVS